MNLKLLLRYMPDLYLILDPHFNVVDCSDAYEKTTMVKRKNLVGRYLFDVFPDNPDDPSIAGVSTVTASLKRVLENKIPETMTDLKYDIQVPVSEGGVFEERFWTTINIPILNSSGEVIYILMRIQDVTEFVKLKQQHQLEKKKHSMLEARLMAEFYERTQNNDFINKQLQQTLEGLNRSNMELEQFAYIASHDLQEPLRMVASFTQLLERRYKDALDKDAREFIQYAVDGAQRMQAQLNDLLVYSRVTREKNPFEQINLESALESVLNNISITIEEKKVEITHDPLPTVYGNKIQMVQLFQNLLLNGIKFQPKNQQARLHISATMNGKEWLFSVRDNGIGIESPYLDKIFIIFKRLHTRAEYEGTGVGLAVCKKIVDRHGGKIWVESEVGKGTTVYFTLPQKK